MHLVTLGNGTGQATLLRGLRAYACDVTAIVGVTDNGGHSGQLRRLLHMPQVGDTRQCLSALLDDTSVWGQLLRHRFTEGEMSGFSVGNVMLAALTQQHGSFCTAVEAVRQAAGLRQRVLPVADEETDIGAELCDGRRLIGEWEILRRQPRTPITRLFLQPPVAAHPAVRAALAAADCVVLCPGSFLTGLIALLLHPGVREILHASQVPCVSVGNLMTQPGQTDDYTACRHWEVLTSYLGRPVEAVLLNNGPIPPELLAIYATQGAYPVRNDFTGSETLLVRADLVDRPDPLTLRSYTRPTRPGTETGWHLIRHEPHRLAAQIVTLATHLAGGRATRPLEGVLFH